MRDNSVLLPADGAAASSSFRKAVDFQMPSEDLIECHDRARDIYAGLAAVPED